MSLSDSNEFIKEILLHLELVIELTVGKDFTGVSFKLHVSADPFSLLLPARGYYHISNSHDVCPQCSLNHSSTLMRTAFQARLTGPS